LLLQKQSFVEKYYNVQQNQSIKQMIDYIIDHLDSISFAEFADYFHYSQSYASRFIKKYTGMTFTDLVKNMRLKKSCKPSLFNFLNCRTGCPSNWIFWKNKFLPELSEALWRHPF